MCADLLLPVMFGLLKLALEGLPFELVEVHLQCPAHHGVLAVLHCAE